MGITEKNNDEVEDNGDGPGNGDARRPAGEEADEDEHEDEEDEASAVSTSAATAAAAAAAAAAGGGAEDRPSKKQRANNRKKATAVTAATAAGAETAAAAVTSEVSGGSDPSSPSSAAAAGEPPSETAAVPTSIGADEGEGFSSPQAPNQEQQAPPLRGKKRKGDKATEKLLATQQQQRQQGDDDDGGHNGGGGSGSGGGGGEGDGGGAGGARAVAFSVGREMPAEMRPMASSRLSKWALKFTGKRTYAPPAVPVIEPINDEFLASFGRSYADAKKRAKSGGDKSSSDKDDDDDGGGGGGDDDDDDDDDCDDSAAADEKDGDGAAVGGDHGSPSPKTSLSSGRKKHGVFAANLPYELCDEQKLEYIFKGFGRITAVVLSRPPEGRTVAGTARLFFATADEARNAVSRADGMELNNRPISVREAWASGGGMTPSRYFVEPEEAAKAATLVVCANCSIPGHRWDRCPQPATRCTLCGAFGHDDKNCMFNACTRCLREGHLANNCPEDKAMELEHKPVCLLCGKGGHSIDACKKIHKGRNQAKFSCATCRDEGHTECKGEMDTVIGCERGRAMTCCNCGLDSHDWRSCPYDSMDEILRRFGYSFNSGRGNPRGGNKRRRSAGPCFNCNKPGHEKFECPELRTQTPGRYGRISSSDNDNRNNHNRIDLPLVPAEDWRREWSNSRGNGDRNNNNNNNNYHSPRGDSLGQQQQHHQGSAHLPHSYLSGLLQPPAVVLPLMNGGPLPAPPSPHLFPYEPHHNQQQGGGFQYQQHPSTPEDYGRWGDASSGGRTYTYHPGRGNSNFEGRNSDRHEESSSSIGGRGSSGSYYPGGNSGGGGGGGGGGGRRRREDRRFSGGGGDGGDGGGGGRYNSRDIHQQRSHGRYSDSSSRRRPRARKRDSNANPRSYGY
eukprot:g9631.t1